MFTLVHGWTFCNKHCPFPGNDQISLLPRYVWVDDVPNFSFFRRICIFFEEGTCQPWSQTTIQTGINRPSTFFLPASLAFCKKKQGLPICLTFRDLFFLGFKRITFRGLEKKTVIHPFFWCLRRTYYNPRTKSQDHGPKGRQLWLHSMGQNSTVLDTPRAVVVPGRPGRAGFRCRFGISGDFSNNLFGGEVEDRRRYESFSFWWWVKYP